LLLLPRRSGGRAVNFNDGYTRSVKSDVHILSACPAVYVVQKNGLCQANLCVKHRIRAMPSSDERRCCAGNARVNVSDNGAMPSATDQT
jgi:hypothetical protein